MSDYRIDFEAMPWETSEPGVRQKAVQRNGQRLRLVEFIRGEIEPDWCTAGHIGYVLAGEMRIDFDGCVTHFFSGDGLIIPEGQDSRHKVLVVSEVVKLVLVESV